MKQVILHCLIFAVLIAVFSCSSGDEFAKKEGLQLSDPSKMSDIASVLLRGFSEKKQSLNREDVTVFLMQYFEALAKQNIISISPYIWENFSSPSYKNKKAYIKALKKTLNRQRILKMKPEFLSFYIFSDYALIRLNVKQVRGYLKSGFILENEEGMILRIIKVEDSLKIARMTPERFLPKSQMKDGSYEDKWMSYKFKLPASYEIFSADYKGVMEYISMPSKSKPVEMFLSPVWVARNVESAYWMAGNDIGLLKNEKDFKLIGKRKFSHRGYDCALLEFSYLDGGHTKQERRIYFWREPIMYVAGIQSPSGKAFESSLGDFNSFISSFEYLKTEKNFAATVRPGTEVSGNVFKSGFYGCEIEPPLDWEIAGYMPNLVQYVWLKSKKDTLAYFYAEKTQDGKGIEVENTRINKMRDMLFKYGSIIKSEKSTHQGFPAIKASSKFKRKFLRAYAYREEITVQKNDYRYRFGIVSKSLSDKERKEQFEKFLGGIKLE